MKFSIIVIGAGASGLRCAGVLRDAGHEVRLFDKGRTIGGRCATRQTDYGPISHGVQMFDAADPRLTHVLTKMETHAVCFKTGAYQPVTGDGPFAVPIDGANAFAQTLADGLAVNIQTTIAKLERAGGRWTASDTNGREYHADIAVIAIPPAQAAAFGVTPPDLPLHKADYRGQVAALIAADQPLNLPPTGPLDVNKLSWITTSPDGKRALVFADYGTSDAMMETDKDEIASWIWRQLAGSEAKPPYLKGHRWRYSRVKTPIGQPAYFAPANQLGFCGDWFIGPNIGDALESGAALAEMIVANAA